jgi:hypothetical protein
MASKKFKYIVPEKNSSFGLFSIVDHDQGLVFIAGKWSAPNLYDLPKILSPG